MRLWHKLTGSRSRKVATGTLTTLLVCAIAAFGYWALMGNGKGSTAPTVIGKAPVAGEIVFTPSFAANQLTPSTKAGEVPLTVKVTNATSAASQIRKLNWSFAVDAEHATAGCKASWFIVDNGGTLWTELEGSGAASPIPVPIESSTNITSLLSNPAINMTETNVDQKSCLDAAEGGVGTESAHITLTLTSTP
jgi:hypothetical protein